MLVQKPNFITHARNICWLCVAGWVLLEVTLRFVHRTFIRNLFLGLTLMEGRGRRLNWDVFLTRYLADPIGRSKDGLALKVVPRWGKRAMPLSSHIDQSWDVVALGNKQFFSQVIPKEDWQWRVVCVAVCPGAGESLCQRGVWMALGISNKPPDFGKSCVHSQPRFIYWKLGDYDSYLIALSF